jgi:NDP-sugar pyrophosphorylase family protein
VQAILLATGETKKLQPLTESIPAPMVPVANRPVMSYAIETLARFGIKDIVVSLFHSAALIESYFGDGSRWGVSLDYVLQREPWGTAGALCWAKNTLHEYFLVVPAESIFELDIEALIDHHHSRQDIGTVVVHEINIERTHESKSTKNEGTTLFPEDIAVGQTLCETGVYVFQPEVLDFIPARSKFEISDHLLPSLSDAGYSISKFISCNYWNALETFESYFDAQKYFLTQNEGNGSESIRYSMFTEESSSQSKQISQGIWVGRNSLIHPTVSLEPPVSIGDNTRIGPYVDLGPNSIIGDNVVVDSEASVRDSVLLDGTYVGQLVNIEGRVVYKRLVIDLTTAQSIKFPDQLLIGQTFNAISDSSLRRIADLFFAWICIFFSFPLTILLSILSYLFNGHFIEWVPALGTSNKPNGQYSTGAEDIFNLLHFPILNDERESTWVGHQIERLEWHRLPELWNVIKGDMSMVGVKPLSPTDKTLLNEPWQKSRNVCYPGFTGLWYTEHSHQVDLEDILVTDAYYAATRHWRKDISIVWLTVVTWFRKVFAQFR